MTTRTRGLGLRIAGLLLAFTAANAATNGPPRMAVLEFDAKPGAEAWAAGLGDLMEISLQKAGAELVTRRFVSLVLNERREQRSGLVGDGSGICAQLPGVEFLVKGSIGAANARDFTIETRMLDTCSGTEQRSFSETGSYPAGIVPALDRLAGKMARAVSAPEPEAMPDAPGFTTSPEVMVTFYQGLEHLMAGRPEFAAEDFDVAARSDPRFLVARRWSAKAYEALGLEDFAAVDYSLIAAARTNLGIALPGMPATGRGSRVITVLFLGPGGAFDPRTVTAIKDGMRDEAGISLFAPDWMKDLIDEGDLRVSGEFAPFAAMDRRVWLQSDYAVVFQSATIGGKQIQARVVSLVTGRPAGIRTGDVSDLRALCRTVAATLRAPSIGGEPVRASRSANCDAPRVVPGATVSNAFPLALARLACEPANRERMKDWYYRIHYRNTAHRAAVMRRLLRSIPPGDPDEAAWRLFALQELRGLERSTPFPSSQHYFAEFLRKYPDSLSAACVDYQIGWELMSAGKLDESRAWLMRAADRIHRDDGAKDSHAAIYFLPAYASWKLGDLDNARRYQAWVNELVARSDPNAHSIVPTTLNEELDSGRANALKGGCLLGGVRSYEPSIRLEGVDYKDLRSASRWLDAVLRNGGENTVASLDALYARARNTAAADARANADRYFMALVEHGKTSPKEASHHRQYEAPALLTALLRASFDEAFQARCRAWAATLAGQDRPGNPATFELLLISGDWARARELAARQRGGVEAFRFCGKIELFQHGRRAQAECYARLLNDWQVGHKNDYDTQMHMLAASAWKLCHDPVRAAVCYEKASMQTREGHREYWLGAKYELAVLQLEQGNALRATTLLKEIAETKEARTANRYRIAEEDPGTTSCSQGVSMIQKDVYTEAVELLGQIRGATTTSGSNTRGTSP